MRIFDQNVVGTTLAPLERKTPLLVNANMPCTVGNAGQDWMQIYVEYEAVNGIDNNRRYGSPGVILSM